MSDGYDTVFSLPFVDSDTDSDPDTELGVLLMGLGPERLLAGLGVAASGTGDPATVTLLVDQLRHEARPDLTMAAAITAGAGRWRSARSRLAAADPGVAVRSAALRRLWSSALTAVTGAGLAVGHAERVYLAACWLRRTEIDRAVIDRATEDEACHT
ncbi:DUF6187 family protein [Actinophytocola sp.]|uniref:DUF6187 family protein n=1 Tax=Actinophytocola sp. TaxID=1872138 RepID=UPI003D6AAE78